MAGGNRRHPTTGAGSARDAGSDSHTEGQRLKQFGTCNWIRGQAKKEGVARFARVCKREHLGDPETMENTDTGATPKLTPYLPKHRQWHGEIRALYLQGETKQVAPIFNAWMEPFHSLGMTTAQYSNIRVALTILDFNSVASGFQLIPGPMDYDTRTPPSNMDLYERVQESGQ